MGPSLIFDSRNNNTYTTRGALITSSLQLTKGISGFDYKGGFFNAKGVSIPVAVSVFPGEQYEAPRSWSTRAYPKLIYYNKVDKGGHFAAWEQPMLFVAELRAAFKSLR